MANIKIDDKDYDFDALPQDAKNQVNMIQAVDKEPQQLQIQTAILQTARLAYSKELSTILNKDNSDSAIKDAIVLS
jgi:hypothetical protein